LIFEPAFILLHPTVVFFVFFCWHCCFRFARLFLF